MTLRRGVLLGIFGSLLAGVGTVLLAYKGTDYLVDGFIGRTSWTSSTFTT